MIVLSKTSEKRERFRTVPGQFRYFPDNISPDEYELIGYLLGNRVAKYKYLSLDLFDSIRFLRFSDNPINKKRYMHVEAFRKDTGYTTLVMQKKRVH